MAATSTCMPPLMAVGSVSLCHCCSSLFLALLYQECCVHRAVTRTASCIQSTFSRILLLGPGDVKAQKDTQQNHGKQVSW